MKEYMKEYQRCVKIARLGLLWSDRLEGIWRVKPRILKSIWPIQKYCLTKVIDKIVHSSLLLDDVQYFAYYAAFLDGDYTHS